MVAIDNLADPLRLRQLDLVVPKDRRSDLRCGSGQLQIWARFSVPRVPTRRPRSAYNWPGCWRGRG